MSSVFETSADVQLRMPVETMNVSFRPQSFFKINPAIDVPEAEDTKSVLVSNRENRPCCN